MPTNELENMIDDIKRYVKETVDKSIREGKIHVADTPHIDIDHDVVLERPSGDIAPEKERHGVKITVTIPITKDIREHR